MQQDWSMVLIACLGGHNGMLPSAAEAEEPLKMMVQTVQTFVSPLSFVKNWIIDW